MSRWPVEPEQVALGLIEQADTGTVERLLAEDPAFRAAVEDARALMDRLRALPPDIWEPAVPPPFVAPVPHTTPGRERSPRRRLIWRVAPVGAALAAAIAVVVMVTTGDDPTKDIRLDPVASTPGRAELVVTAATARLIARGIPPTDATHHYEAWVGDAQGRMVSMGTFRVDASGNAQVAMPLTVDLAKFTDVDISLEPDDGNPAHSTRSVFHAKLGRS